MKTVKIIKIGGNIINNEKVLHSFLYNFSQLEGPKVLIHGGGKSASDLAKKMNTPVNMIDGRRITDAQTLDIITMVYAGKINKKIIAKLQANNTNSLGFTGADGNTIKATKRSSSPIDYGFAGDIIKVNTQIPILLINNQVTPVFCAITHDKNGQLLNTNADTIAAEIAIALSTNYTTELYYCFEEPGVLTDINNKNSIIENIDSIKYTKLKEQGVIFKGMLPKLDNCFHAINNKVNKVCVGNTDMLFKKNTTHTSIKI
ncbi:acetylglutamate kinase [Tenacibaculum halocynthiae]|uniref:acetylglutamate kinase n=1 Tax=Tenacibaculum halocynthiae TaxID=1254437 RepID=UPI003D65D167